MGGHGIGPARIKRHDEAHFDWPAHVRTLAALLPGGTDPTALIRFREAVDELRELGSSEALERLWALEQDYLATVNEAAKQPQPRASHHTAGRVASPPSDLADPARNAAVREGHADAERLVQDTHLHYEIAKRRMIDNANTWEPDIAAGWWVVFVVWCIHHNLDPETGKRVPVARNLNAFFRRLAQYCDGWPHNTGINKAATWKSLRDFAQGAVRRALMEEFDQNPAALRQALLERTT